MRRRRSIRRRIKGHPIVAWMLRLLWPRASVAPTNPAAVRAENFQIVGFGVVLLAVIAACTFVWITQTGEGETHIDNAEG